jgi:hypothetical protein
VALFVPRQSVGRFRTIALRAAQTLEAVPLIYIGAAYPDSAKASASRSNRRNAAFD